MVTATLAREAVAPARLQGRVWVSYARLSKAKNDGRGGSLAIDRQHLENRAYIARVDPGARVIELQDDGFSGFLDVYRPSFEQALGLVERREVHALVGWHADRLTRQVEVTARIVRACETARVELHTTLGGWHSDPTRLYIESVVAEGESRQKRNRSVSKHQQLARDGGFTGGERRFGYTAGKVPQVLESEAAVIRDMAGRLLMGESLASLARSLNAAGIPTVRGGKEWGPSTVRSLLTQTRLIGRRTYDGQEWASAFPAILDENTFRAVGAYLSKPDRRTTDDRAGKSKHLLTGLAVCDLCSAPVGGLVRKGGVLLYRCTGCGGFERRGEEIDAMVGRYVVKRLEGLDPNGLFTSDDANRQTAALVTERAALAAEREELAGLLAAGRLKAVGYAVAESALDQREAEIGAALAVLAESAAAPVRALEGATGPVAASVWADWTKDTSGAGLARRRAVIGYLVDVRIGKAGKGHKGAFNEATVSVEYRDLT